MRASITHKTVVFALAMFTSSALSTVALVLAMWTWSALFAMCLQLAMWTRMAHSAKVSSLAMWAGVAKSAHVSSLLMWTQNALLLRPSLRSYRVLLYTRKGHATLYYQQTPLLLATDLVGFSVKFLKLVEDRYEKLQGRLHLGII